jgi:hypothetical protein
VEHRPGELARALEPIARAGTDPPVGTGYHYPGNETKADAAAGRAELLPRAWEGRTRRPGVGALHHLLGLEKEN